MSSKKTASIDVPGGFNTHGKIAHKIVLRYPTVEDYMELGEVTISVPTADGRSVNRLDRDVVRQYAERLMIEPTDSLLISDLPFDVGRDLVGAVISFFHPAPKKAEPSTTSEKTSSTEGEASSQQNTSSE